MPTLRTYAEPVNDTVMIKIPKEYASYAFQVILVPYKAAAKREIPTDIHMFDCLHSDWGGEGGAVEIAESIRNARRVSRQSTPW